MPFTIFDRVTNKPLVIHLTEPTDKGEEIVLSEKALVLCKTAEAARRLLKELFPVAVQAFDEQGNPTDRYQVKHSRGSGRAATKKLVEITGVTDFWDGKRLGKYEGDKS